MFDEMMRECGPLSTAVGRELLRKEQHAMQAYTVAAGGGGGVWKGIRIKVPTKDLEDGNKYCTADGENHPDFRGKTGTCASYLVPSAEKNKTLLNVIIPRSIKLHVERLLVRPVTDTFGCT